MDAPARPTKTFWIGLAVIVILAAVPRLLSYGYSLPYVDHPDEPNKYLAAQAWRGLYEHHEEGYYDGYPPGYLIVNYVVQIVTQPFGVEGLAETVRVMRLLAVAVNLGTLIVIALTARLAGGTAAGWAAGAAWGASAQVIKVGVYAIQDPFVYFWVALALYLAAVALVGEERWHFALWSIAIGLVAIAFKYTVLAAVLPGGLAALVAVIKAPRRRWWVLPAAALAVATTGVWVYFQAEAMSGWQRLAQTATSAGVAGVLDAGRVLNNWWVTAVPLSGIVLLLVLAIGLVAYLIAGKTGRTQVRGSVLLLCLALIITIPWLAATFSEVTLNRIKDVLPATAAACVLLGAAVAQAAYALPERSPRWLHAALPAVLTLPVLLGQVGPAEQIVAERMPPDRRVTIREYFDVNLDAGTVLVTYDNEKTFNPYWGGLIGREWIDWYRDDTPADTSVAEWRDERGISYALLPTWMVDELEDSDDGQAFLANLYPLKTFAGGEPQRGPEVVLYRLTGPEHDDDVRFGEAIQLVGYDGGTESASPGDVLGYRFYWQADEAPSENYSLFVHLMPVDADELVAQADGNPAAPERLTQTWDDPTEVLISPWFQLTLPADLPAGEYHVLMGLYNFETGERLPVSDGTTGEALGDAYQLAMIEAR